MSPHAATYQQTLRAIDTLLGWRHEWMVVDYGRTELESRTWHRCGHPADLVRLVRDLDERYSAEVRLGLPQPRIGRGPAGATILWARVTGKEQQQRAFRFRPLPTLVLREGGTRRLLIWALKRWVPYADVEDMNRRLAYALHARQCDGVPEALGIPAPGTCLTVGRTRPVPVMVSRLETVAYLPDEVVGRLRRPPEVDRSQWGKRAASREAAA